jgi:DNA-binding MarR family transcriptional regulator
VPDPGGLSVAQLELLSAVADNPGARPGQLARPLRLAPSSVATLVNGLRAAGLITRTEGDRDRRTALLRLTPHGTTVVGGWQQLNERILRAAISAMTPDSAAALDAAVPALAELTAAVDALADGRLE